MLVVLNWLIGILEFLGRLPATQRSFGQDITMLMVPLIIIAAIVIPLFCLWRYTLPTIGVALLIVVGWIGGTLAGSLLALLWQASAQFFLWNELTANGIFVLQNFCIVVLTAQLLIDGRREWVEWTATH